MNDGTPLLHRDDPSRDPLGGHVKVTREDWLAQARDTLVRDGVAQVKVLALASRMEVSRSSFYWYFRNRDDLLQALLEEWEARNTASIATQCARPASNITEGVCNFFLCFVDGARFDSGLDFAVREWARRDEVLRARVDAADAARLKAVTAMFAAHGFDPREADARARILYFMQLGYHALDVREPIAERLDRIGPYLKGFTGQEPDAMAMRRFLDTVDSLGIA
ncbi:TetR family transcriptional regulator [Sulfitobacter alexandrii]|uniref:TetR family transcriptional regulator n=1 Tax=Sulfitobacter alexandrii TaxID=1917485 RepID=A0A1J0WJT9_9RHOB|nr:TetR/AcrR family transcriptional regulator [Sulfitobacter alexandrii]APE44571.1 TetR family transcriptional regulator [Sulfitobacter alexandrii]